MKAELAGLGKMIPDNDIWIAATARQYELPPVTRDAHFGSVPRLKMLAWWLVGADCYSAASESISGFLLS